jgi:ABC-type Fe3+/spermidine/putrescine transport system ATPase subunit
VAEFIGEANFLAGRVERAESGWLQVRLGSQELRVAGRDIPAGPVVVAARPEAIRLSLQGPGVSGTIEKVSYLGSVVDYTVATELGSILVTDYAMAMGILPPETAVRLEFLTHGVAVLAST